MESVIRDPIFSINITPLDRSIVQESIATQEAIKQQRIEFNNKFINEGYNLYVTIMKNEISKVIDDVRNGKTKRIDITSMDTPIEVTIDGESRTFPLHFFHYGQKDKNSKWTDRICPWTSFDTPREKFPFKELQKVYHENNYFLQDLSDPTKGRGLHVFLSPKLLESKNLWHGFQKIN